MAREVDSASCDARIIMGDVGSGAILPCNAWGKGHCLKDLRRDTGMPNVDVLDGTCKADAQDGIDETSKSSHLISEIRASETSVGINLVLDELLGESTTIIPEDVDVVILKPKE